MAQTDNPGAHMQWSLQDNSEQIADIQRKLASLGLYHGPRTEKLDDLRTALQVFQRQTRITPPLRRDGVCDQATWNALNQEAGALFSEVFQYELDGLRPAPQPDASNMPALPEAVHSPSSVQAHATVQAPAAAHLSATASGMPALRPARKREVMARAHASCLAGLALSGGGIRSATFNLGVLQAMAQLKLLRHIDYLSTVSGGGFIGAWFSKWVMEEGGDVCKVEAALTPGSQDAPKLHEANEIKFLRQFSNYLSPRASLFDADSWALLANYLRNTVLNMCLIVAMLAAVFSLPGLLGWFATHYQYHEGWGIVAQAALAMAVYFSAFSISLQPGQARRHWLTAQRQGNVLALVVLPLMVAGFCGSMALWRGRCELAAVCAQTGASLPPLPNQAAALPEVPGQVAQLIKSWALSDLIVPGVLFFLVWLAGWSAAQLLNPGPIGQPWITRRWRTLLQEGAGHLLGAIAALALGTVLTVLALRLFAHWYASNPYGAPVIHLVTFGMPVLLIIAGLTMIVLVGLLGRLYSDSSREWWSRQGGWCAILILAWIALFGASLYAPPMMAWVHQRADGWGNAVIASGWLGTTLLGLLAGRRASSTREADPKMQALAMLAPWVFSVGILGLVATLVHFAANPAHLAAPDAAPNTTLGQFFLRYLDWRQQAPLVPQLVLLFTALGVGLILAWRLDINKFSLYMTLRSRLVRTFLGASNRRRAPHPFTGFDPHDDPPLAKLRKTGGLQRPYPLINTTLNLVGGKELAWQTRKTTGFLFSPGFCGFELARTPATGAHETAHDALRGCFRPTQEYGGRGERATDEDQGTRLGMATAISGAAISTSVREQPSKALNFLMTLFNLRLGRWCGNPLRSRWQTSGPGVGLFCLLSELLGATDASANYVHLTDGGHFENLGLYELVRRRCHLIVVVDASADGGFSFADLGNAIRRCYVDLGIEIDINVCNIDTNQDGFSTEQCVAGRILYGKADPQAADGTLLYIKPSLSGKETAEVLNHRKADPDFPHQTGFGHWFDENRFESYRALGYRTALSAFSAACEAANLPAASSGSTTSPPSGSTSGQPPAVPASVHEADTAPPPAFPMQNFCSHLLAQWERPIQPASGGY